MTRLIDADKLKEYIDDCECCEKCDMKGFMCNEYCELPDCVTPQWERVLNEQPTVEAEPVRHGKWTKIPSADIGTCSCCGDKWGSVSVMNYCPNCGAKMDGEQNETD